MKETTGGDKHMQPDDIIHIDETGDAAHEMVGVHPAFTLVTEILNCYGSLKLPAVDPEVWKKFTLQNPGKLFLLRQTPGVRLKVGENLYDAILSEGPVLTREGLFIGYERAVIRSMVLHPYTLKEEYGPQEVFFYIRPDGAYSAGDVRHDEEKQGLALDSLTDIADYYKKTYGKTKKPLQVV